MFNCGIIRRFVDNLPLYSTASTVETRGKEYRPVFDHLPETKKDYRNRVIDFNDCFQYCSKTKLSFNCVPDDALDLVKCFALDQIDQGARVRTLSKTVDKVGAVLRQAEKASGRGLLSLSTADILDATAAVCPTSKILEREALSYMKRVLAFARAEMNIILPVDAVAIERRLIALTDAVRGLAKAKHSQELAPRLMDEIITGLYVTMHNRKLRTSVRMTAAITLLQTQLGLRTEELPALETNCLVKVDNYDGTFSDMVVYNCMKSSTSASEVLKVKTICTPLARETILYMLQLRKKVRGHENSPFLFVEQSSRHSGLGYVYPVENLRARYKRLCASHLLHIFCKPIPGIPEKSIVFTKKVKGEYRGTKVIRAYVPNMYCYRVTFACRLFAAGLDVDYINSIMSHTPGSNVDDAYIRNTQIPRVLLDEISEYFKDIDI